MRGPVFVPHQALHMSQKLWLCCHCWHLKDNLLWDYTDSTPEAVWLFFLLHFSSKRENTTPKMAFLFSLFLLFFLSLRLKQRSTSQFTFTIHSLHHGVHSGWNRSRLLVHRMGLAETQWAFTIKNSAQAPNFYLFFFCGVILHCVSVKLTVLCWNPVTSSNSSEVQELYIFFFHLIFLFLAVFPASQESLPATHYN